MINVLATYRVAEGNGERVAELLTEYIALTRAEPGCVTFNAHRSLEDPAVFVLYEQYEDQAAFDAHVASEHFNGLGVEHIRPLLADRTVAMMELLEPAGG